MAAAGRAVHSLTGRTAWSRGRPERAAAAARRAGHVQARAEGRRGGPWAPAGVPRSSGAAAAAGALDSRLWPGLAGAAACEGSGAGSWSGTAGSAAVQAARLRFAERVWTPILCRFAQKL